MEERKIEVNIRNEKGEEPESLVLGAKFKGGHCVSMADGYLAEQMALTQEMVKRLGEKAMQVDETGAPYYAAAILLNLAKGVGKENLMRGVDIINEGVEKQEKEVVADKSIDELFEELLKA